METLATLKKQLSAEKETLAGLEKKQGMLDEDLRNIKKTLDSIGAEAASAAPETRTKTLEDFLNQKKEYLVKRAKELPPKAKEVFEKTRELWKNLDNKPGGKVVKRAAALGLIGVPMVIAAAMGYIPTEQIVGKLASRAVLSTGLNAVITSNLSTKFFDKIQGDQETGGWRKYLTAENIMSGLGIGTVTFLSGGIAGAIGVGGFVGKKILNKFFDRAIEIGENVEFWKRMKTIVNFGLTTSVAVGTLAVATAHAETESHDTPHIKEPAKPEHSATETTSVETKSDSENNLGNLQARLMGKIFGTSPSEGYQTLEPQPGQTELSQTEKEIPAERDKMRENLNKTTEEKITQTQPARTEVNPNAIVTSEAGHNSVSGVLKIQFQNDHNLARAWGFDIERLNDDKYMAQTLHDKLQETGVIGTGEHAGQELRIMEANKVSFEASVDEHGNHIIIEKNLETGQMEIHHKGDGFETSDQREPYENRGDTRTHHYNNGKEIVEQKETEQPTEADRGGERMFQRYQEEQWYGRHHVGPEKGEPGLHYHHQHPTNETGLYLQGHEPHDQPDTHNTQAKTHDTAVEKEYVLTETQNDKIDELEKSLKNLANLKQPGGHIELNKQASDFMSTPMFSNDPMNQRWNMPQNTEGKLFNFMQKIQKITEEEPIEQNLLNPRGQTILEYIRGTFEKYAAEPDIWKKLIRLKF